MMRSGSARFQAKWFLWLAVAALACLAPPGARAEDPVSSDGVWRVIDPRAAAKPASGDAWVAPRRFVSYALSTDALLAALADAPMEGTAGATPAVLQVPMPAGGYESFAVVETGFVAPEVAALCPGLKTWRGAGLDDPTADLRMTLGPAGLSVQVLSADGSAYIVPLAQGDSTVHACFAGSDAATGEGDALCDTFHPPGRAPLRMGGAVAALTTGSLLRTYRMVVAATDEYRDLYGGVAGAVAALTTTVNNVNAVYERDATITFNIVSTVIAVPPATDGITAPLSSPQSNTDAQTLCDTVGTANYDVGHLFHQNPFNMAGFSFSGNAGAIGSVCAAATKGSAWSQCDQTSGSPVWTSLVAHEMGHQCGATHTFNGSGCPAGQYSGGSSWEPSGGTTVMSYAFGCGADQVTGVTINDTLFFHTGNIAQIFTYMRTGGGDACDVETPTGNTAPTVNAGADFTIPISTPFVLTATGSDADGDPLTYCWEEKDAGGAQAAGTTVDNGTIPLFRSFQPVTDPSRTFPALSALLAGGAALFPATVGEQLPVTNRTMNFFVTARDNRAGFGGVTDDSAQVTSTTAAGPFAVTSPNGGETWPSGSTQTVTWNVAGTDVAPVSTANVRILLSTDGGLTSPIVLAASTPNDGSQSITVPLCTLSATCRVRVEAVGNIYFDVSDADFEMVDDSAPVVTCNAARGLLWMPSNGMLDVAFTHSATDDCDPTPGLVDIRVFSDEGNGAAPYSPDATLVGPVLRLRAQRDITQNGRVYLIVVRYADASGNIGVDCCTVVVPLSPTTSSISSVLLQASTARALCLLGGGAPPPGYLAVYP